MGQQFRNLVDLITSVQTHIQSNLIVAAASGVQSLSGISDAAGQLTLQKCVDIFLRLINVQSSSFQFVLDLSQTVYDIVTVLLADDSLFCKHRSVGNAAADVLSPETLIKADRSIKLKGKCVWLFCKSSAP